MQQPSTIVKFHVPNVGKVMPRVFGFLLIITRLLICIMTISSSTGSFRKRVLSSQIEATNVKLNEAIQFFLSILLKVQNLVNYEFAMREDPRIFLESIRIVT